MDASSFLKRDNTPSTPNNKKISQLKNPDSYYDNIIVIIKNLLNLPEPDEILLRWPLMTPPTILVPTAPIPIPPLNLLLIPEDL